MSPPCHSSREGQTPIPLPHPSLHSGLRPVAAHLGEEAQLGEEVEVESALLKLREVWAADFDRYDGETSCKSISRMRR